MNERHGNNETSPFSNSYIDQVSLGNTKSGTEPCIHLQVLLGHPIILLDIFGGPEGNIYDDCQDEWQRIQGIQEGFVGKEITTIPLGVLHNTIDTTNYNKHGRKVHHLDQPDARPVVLIRSRRPDTDMTFDQEETEETIGNGLKNEAHEDDRLPGFCKLVGGLKATPAGL